MVGKYSRLKKARTHSYRVEMAESVAKRHKCHGTLFTRQYTIQQKDDCTSIRWKADGVHGPAALVLGDGATGVFHEAMAGFRQRRGRMDSISNIAASLEQARATPHPAYTVLLDIHCGSDAIPHDTILLHLGHNGVFGRVLKYLKGLLANRVLRVRVPGSVSSPRGVAQSVPQGSVPSPFISIFMAALPYSFPGNILRRRVNMTMYVDDVVLRPVANRQRGSPARVELQHGLNWTTRHIEGQVLPVSAS